MPNETMIVRSDGYWFRMVVRKLPKYFVYTWGTGDGLHNYRAELEYLGGGTYILSKRRYNDKFYELDSKFKRRHRKRIVAYDITIKLIERLLQ